MLSIALDRPIEARRGERTVRLAWLATFLSAYAAALQVTAEIELLAAHARRDAALAWHAAHDH